MTPQDVEAVYEALARKIDAIAPDQTEPFLAKLALLLAYDCADIARVQRRIDEAALNLDHP